MLILVTPVILFVVHFLFQKMMNVGLFRELGAWQLFVNTSNCGFCVKQVEFLGENAHKINIIHCDDKKNVRECADLHELPLWKKGNRTLPGARLSLYSLRQLTRM